MWRDNGIYWEITAVFLTDKSTKKHPRSHYQAILSLFHHEILCFGLSVFFEMDLLDIGGKEETVFVLELDALVKNTDTSLVSWQNCMLVYYFF